MSDCKGYNIDLIWLRCPIWCRKQLCNIESDPAIWEGGTSGRDQGQKSAYVTINYKYKPCLSKDYDQMTPRYQPRLVLELVIRTLYYPYIYQAFVVILYQCVLIAIFFRISANENTRRPVFTSKKSIAWSLYFIHHGHEYLPFFRSTFLVNGIRPVPMQFHRPPEGSLRDLWKTWPFTVPFLTAE